MSNTNEIVSRIKKTMSKEKQPIPEEEINLKGTSENFDSVVIMDIKEDSKVEAVDPNQSYSAIHAAKSENFRRGMVLEFEDLRYSVTVKKEEIQILKSISGCANPGDILAIMGPSGVGKSTLLDILGDRKESGSITGSLLVNGEPRDSDFKFYCSYVTQEDILMPTATVYETLRLHADLRLPVSWSGEEKDRRVRLALEAVGLTEKADSKIGGILPGGVILRGLSGGEKKRVNIGCGLVTSPSVLVLDEPTSGLDSVAAMVVMQTVRKVARKNVTVILTIHQPRFEIFSLIDKFMLLLDGRTAYHGEHPLEFVKSFGYDPPTGVNPADFILDSLVRIKEEGKLEQMVKTNFANYEKDRDSERQKSIRFNNKKEDNLKVSRSIFDRLTGVYMTPLWWQYLILVKRNARDFIRNPGATIVRFVVALMVSLLISACFAGLNFDQKDALSKAGVIFFSMQNFVLLPFTSISLCRTPFAYFLSLAVISRRTLFNHERGGKIFHPLPYFLSLMTLETAVIFGVAFILVTPFYWITKMNTDFSRYCWYVFVGFNLHLAADNLIILITNVTGAVDKSFSVAAGASVIFQLFAGFLVPVSNLPRSFGWLHYINPVHYAFESLIINEFQGVQLSCSGALYCLYPTGEDIISRYGLDEDYWHSNVAVIIAFTIVFVTSSYFALVYLHKEKR